MTSAALAPPAPAGTARMRGALPWLVFAALLVALPWLFPSRVALTLLCAIGVNAVFALSYNMLLGQGGMLSFGHAVYYGLGGYAGVHLMSAIKTAGLPIPMPFVPLAGFACGLVAGAVIGWPCCRRSGTPFAMISLGVGELMAAGGFMFKLLFGGEEGISADRSAGPALLGLKLGPIGNVYWFVAAWLFVAALAMWGFSRTPLGRLSNAVRDNPDRVQFIGFDPRRVRWRVFIAASGFAGLAGAMASVVFEIMTPEALGALPSGSVLLMTYIGGIHAFPGPMLGAALLTLAQSMLSDYTHLWQLYVGLLFMAVVVWAPGGLAGAAKGSVRALRAANAGGLARNGLGLAAVLSAGAGIVLLVETLSRWREGDEPLAPFDVALDATKPLVWLAGAVFILAGWALSRAAREKRA